MRVVITGVGVQSPNGCGREPFWKALKEGQSGIDRISLFPTDSLACKIAGEVKGLTYDCIPQKDRKRAPRIMPLAILAADEALRDSRIAHESLTENERQQFAVILGTGGGGLDFSEREYERFFTNGGRPNPFAIVSSFVGMVSSEVSIHFGFRGPSHVLSTGCTSSTDAIGYSVAAIRSGMARYVLTGGAEACITPGILTAFTVMGTTTTKFNDDPTRGSRPFNLDRDGFVLSEGAWMFVLESYENAVARNAMIYAEIAGYGSTCDAYHKVQIMPGGDESAHAVQIALQNAGVTPDEVEHVNLHGTATKLNDEVETLALKKVFGERAYRIPLAATKSLIGHPQGASGAAGVAATLLAINHGIIHPTINIENPDPLCDLDYTANRFREQTVNIALCNCIAFGSKNSALLLKKVNH